MDQTTKAMGFLLDVPQGFAAAANILSSFPQDVLADLCHEVLDFLMYRVGSVDTDILQEKLAPAGVIVPTERAQGAVNALTFTFRASIHAEVAAEDLTTELKSFGASVWTAKAVKVLTYVWSQRGAEACAEVKQLANDVMNIGRLVSFNWKLGLSTESSLVKGLGRAFVAVEIKVVDSGANIVVHSFEMSLPQFQKFSKQMKEMQAVVKEIE